MLVSIVLLAVVISGFSAMTNAAAPQPQAKAASGVLNIAMQQDLPNFNYFDLSSNTVWKSNVIGWNFEGLMGMDRDGSAYPLLAQKVDFAPGPNGSYVATIYLRHNVTFQDGTPMTAKDVIFSYCALRQGTTVAGTSYTIPFDDNNDGTVSFQEIKNHVQYVNAYEVKITTRQAYNYFFLGTLTLPIIPEHIWKNHLVPATKGGSTSVDSEGYTAGIVDVSWNNDPKATIGTGPWMYGGGVKDSYRIEKPYDGYWGKDFRTPNGYPNWNANITEMKFKIYANLDTAVLALQTGEVDYIAWAIEPGKVPVLQKDPNIDLHYMADNGYFYLAFNEKTQPANDLAFRHAVSHVIDKKTAVQRYLGGYGQAGDSAEPPFFTAWYNASVQHYSYDKNIAKKILDGDKVVADNGYVEQDPAWGEKYPVGPSGWRTLPDGTPMKPITLFTPPADYDPVRIKVGQGIAQNLRDLGINIQAKPVDFDTLVAYMQSYNYQMLELGWSLGSDPIGNLADILGPKAIQNTYGWWNASDPNPYYVNSGGVNNTLADKMSQDYATQFQKVINTALTTFNVTKQIKYTKWAQGIVAKATVINVLYYKLNIEATRKSWTGWVEWQGTVFNGLSLGLLHKGNAPPPTPHPGKAYMGVSLNVPGRILMGSNGTASVYVVNNMGAPVSGANVVVKANGSLVSAVPSSGTTNSNGVFTFKLKGTGIGMGVVTVEVSKDGYNMVNKTASVQVVDTMTHVLTAIATADQMSLSPGASTEVTVTVRDQSGNPVSGATVSVDPNLVGFGTVTPTTATTDANGQAKFTYVAPKASVMGSKYANMHAIAKLVFSVAKPGYAYSNTPVLQLLTYNGGNSVWTVYKLDKVTQYVVSPSLGWNTTITVEALNAQGQPLVNETIPIAYSDKSYIVNETDKIVTNGTGYATFTVHFNRTGLPSAPIYIDFMNSTDIRSVGDRLDILYYNGTPLSTPLFGGYIDIADSIINGDTAFTVHLYNINDKPVAQTVNGTGSMKMDLFFNDHTNLTAIGAVTLGAKNAVINSDMIVGGDIQNATFAGKVVYSTNASFNAGDNISGELSGMIDQTSILSNTVTMFSGSFSGSIGSYNVSDIMVRSYAVSVNMLVHGAGDMVANLTIGKGSSAVNVTVKGGISVDVTNPTLHNTDIVGGAINSAHFTGVVINSTSMSAYPVNTSVSLSIAAWDPSSNPNGVISTGPANNAVIMLDTFTGTIGGKNVTGNISTDRPKCALEVVADNNAPVPIAAVVSGTTDGQLVDLDDESNNGGGFLNSASWYTGIGIYTPLDNIATSGDFIGYASRAPNPFDGGLSTWDETGVKSAWVTGGKVTINLPLSMMSYRDLMFNVFVVPYGDVYLYISDPSWSFYQFNITGQQVFESQAVVHRAMTVLIPEIDNMSVTATPGQPFNVKVTLYDQDNNPVVNSEKSGISVKVYNNAKSWKAVYKSVTSPTDKYGNATLSPVAPETSSPSEINVFVLAQGLPNTYSVLESTTIPVVPPYMFVDVTPVKGAVVLGQSLTFNVKVTDAAGNPLSGVDLSVSTTMGAAMPNTVITGPDGTAKFSLDTADISLDNVTTALSSVSLTITGVLSGYNPMAVTTDVVLIKGYSPILSVGIEDGSTISEPNYKVVGYVYDASNVTSVVVNIDGTNHAATVKATNETVVVNGVTYKVYQWCYQFDHLSVGKHTMKVTSIDDRSMESSSTVSFSVTSGTSTNPGGGAIVVGGIDLWIIITIILLIVVVIMGAMLARKPKAAVPEEESEEEEPESEAAEESEEEEPESEAAEESEEEEQAGEEGGEEL